MPSGFVVFLAVSSTAAKPQLGSWRGGAAGALARQRPGLIERVSYEGVPVHAAPESVREQFVERVYATLSVQLLATMILCWFAMTYHPRFLLDILRSRGATLAAVLSPMLVSTMIMNSPIARKTWPWAYVFLSLFTAAESLVLALFMLFVPREIVMRAGLTTAAVVGWLSLYARTTKRNLTRTGPTIMKGLLALVVLELFQFFFFRHSPFVHSLYSAGGALAFAAMLVVNTQQIVGGSSQHATISPDEHVLASVLLYADIIALFMHLTDMMVSNERRRRDENDGGGWRGPDRSSAGFIEF